MAAVAYLTCENDYYGCAITIRLVAGLIKTLSHGNGRKSIRARHKIVESIGVNFPSPRAWLGLSRARRRTRTMVHIGVNVILGLFPSKCAGPDTFRFARQPTQLALAVTVSELQVLSTT